MVDGDDSVGVVEGELDTAVVANPRAVAVGRCRCTIHDLPAAIQSAWWNRELVIAIEFSERSEHMTVAEWAPPYPRRRMLMLNIAVAHLGLGGRETLRCLTRYSYVDHARRRLHYIRSEALPN